MNMRESTCPVCGCGIAPATISFGTEFGCPCCNRMLRISREYEISVRLLAAVVGFALAYGCGFQSVVLFCIGLIFAPLLVSPVWTAARTFSPPTLTLSSAGITTLDLNGHNS